MCVRVHACACVRARWNPECLHVPLSAALRMKYVLHHCHCRMQGAPSRTTASSAVVLVLALRAAGSTWSTAPPPAPPRRWCRARCRWMVSEERGWFRVVYSAMRWFGTVRGTGEFVGFAQ